MELEQNTENGQLDIERRVRLARENFRNGYNCAQSVVLAYHDLWALDRETAAASMSAFGGGMGRMREVCGTVSGMAFLAGMISPATDPKNMAARKENYALIQNFAGKFREMNGSIVCRELLGLVPKNPQPAADGSGSRQAAVGIESPAPSERTAEYYRKRPCEEYVADAARIVGEYIAAKRRE